jgi:hypothetical protein
MLPQLAGSLEMKPSTRVSDICILTVLYNPRFFFKNCPNEKRALSNFRSSNAHVLHYKKGRHIQNSSQNHIFLQIIRNEARGTKPAKHTSSLSCLTETLLSPSLNQPKNRSTAPRFLYDLLSNLVGLPLDGFFCLRLLDGMLLFILLLRRWHRIDSVS